MKNEHPNQKIANLTADFAILNFLFIFLFFSGSLFLRSNRSLSANAERRNQIKLLTLKTE